MKYVFILNGISWKLLMILNCTNSLAGKGVLIDFEEEVFELPYRYFRDILENNHAETNCKDEGKVNESFDSTNM